MRITNQMIQRSLTSGLRGRLQALERAASEAATGRRVRSISDDPIDASQMMRLEAQARDIEQYRRNGTFATTRLSAEDISLSSVLAALREAKNLAATTTGNDPTDPQRLAALSAVQQLKAQLVSLGNTRVGNEYLFGGAQTTTPPFRADGTYVGDSASRSVTVGDGVGVTVNHEGGALFGGAMAAMDDLITALQSGTQADIRTVSVDLESSTQTVMRAQAETGSRLKEIQDGGLRLARIQSFLLERRDALVSVDPAEAIVRLQQEQAALERAYATIGRVMQATLTEYLR